MTARSESLDDLVDAASMAGVVAVLSLAAAGLAVVVVRRITEWQSSPDFFRPEDVLSPTRAGLSPVDWPQRSQPVAAPPRSDPSGGARELLGTAR